MRPVLVLVLAAGCSAGARTAEAPAPVASRLAAAPDQAFSSDGVRIRYRDAGRGDAVVLIHGWTRSLDDMFVLADSLASDHRVVALDIRGFGQSGRPSGAEAYGRRMSDDVVRLLDHLGIRRAHLVGHSMGALIAANVAVRYPDRVSSATLVAGPFYSDSAAFSRETAQWVGELEAGRGLTAFVRWLFTGIPQDVAHGISAQTLQVHDPGHLALTLKGMGGLVVQPPRAGPPALIVAASDDPLTPTSRALAARWPGSQLVVIERTNHNDVFGHAELVAALRRLLLRRESRAITPGARRVPPLREAA